MKNQEEKVVYPSEISESVALVEIGKGYEKAQKVLEDKDKLEELLQRIEHKLQEVPKIGDKLAYVPVLVSMIKSYVKKEYTELPKGTIIAAISALIYFVSPIDLIPDIIPIAGYLDDVTVIIACMKLIAVDIETYMKWREDNGKVLDV